MNRNRWLVIVTALLVVGAVAHHIWANWGLITIHEEKAPLSRIIREIEKQGHVTLKTDLDVNQTVRMHVDKVVVAEALETLAALTDSRWRLAYFVAADKGTITAAVASVAVPDGKLPEGWKTAFVPLLQPIGDVPSLPADPRRDLWASPAAKEAKMQSYLENASRSVAAVFVFPESWNPDVKSAPKPGPVAKVLPKLVSAANGREEEIFLLQRNFGFAQRGGGGGPAEDDGGGPGGPGGGPGGGRGGFGGIREAMEERVKAEIAKLPADQRAAAQREVDERRALFEGLRDMTPEQRQAKVEEILSDPKMQEKMEARISAQDARRSPEQRLDRAHKYVDRKAAVKSGAAPATGGGGGGAGGGRRGP